VGTEGKVPTEVAAVHLLMAAWKEESGGQRRPFFRVTGEGLLSEADIEAIARRLCRIHSSGCSADVATTASVYPLPSVATVYPRQHRAHFRRRRNMTGLGLLRPSQRQRPILRCRLAETLQQRSTPR